MNLILLRAQLRGLSAFRSLLDTPMLKDALQLLDAAARRDGEGPWPPMTKCFTF